MLEFLLIAPFFFFFVALMLDVSRMMLIQNATQDAAFAAARAGAQIGYGSGGLAEQKAQAAFDQSLAVRFGWASTPDLTTLDACSNPADPYYQVRVSYPIQFMFGNILGFHNQLQSETTALSRCEIVRS